MTTYWRVTTADLRPPVRGGAPIWDGAIPHDLPRVDLDPGPDACAPGWHACATPEDAIRIAGEWPDGRPSRLWLCSALPSERLVARGTSVRAATWRIEREATEEEAHAARLRLYAPLAGEGLGVAGVVAEVESWRSALGRPRRDERAVEAGLRAALTARGLDWRPRRYVDARAAWAAWDAWDAWDAWAARAAWAAWDARAAWADATAAWDARDAWADATAWAARDAWDARDALVVYVAAARGWIRGAPDLLTIGLREAYASGLGLVLPSGPSELGWVMEAPCPR